MGYAGYLNPFTLEAQVNMLGCQKSTYPITIAHEMAHQLGYAAENEANFIGSSQCISKQGPILFNMLLLLFGLRHCYQRSQEKETQNKLKVYDSRIKSWNFKKL